ncbi:hypothetical protein [Glutamicibacter protophormiae]|uniref:hypothetical protein n=1 Tax=Glutamicibacter protophormiae TaxID=37930 RepID=UPI003A924B16
MKKTFAALSVVALAVSLTACSSAAEPEAAAPSATEAAALSPSPTPVETSASPKASSDVEVIETSASTTESYAYEILTDEELNAMPAYLQDVYNQCMVDEWQRSLESSSSEYDEALSSSYCQTVVEMNEGMEGVTQQQIDELMQCLDDLSAERPDLFEGYSSNMDALGSQEVQSICQDRLGIS